ncbi:MAG: hypothetical protein K6T30_05490 [Alicyclobacillus sp.]|nr:hypothetical protein [Alicyclobacillus sp.]
MAVLRERVSVDCRGKSITEINRSIREAARAGIPELELLHPQARHNLGVAVTDPIHLVYRGDVGYYAVSLCDGVTAEIHGSAGWAVAENLMRGEVVVHGNAATACAPSLRGGTVVVRGSVGARSGIGMKGGTLIVGGDAGYMTGFMMQKGRIVICGSAARALGDSMYAGEIYVGGGIGEPGSGTEVVEVSEDERDMLANLLESYQIRPPKQWRKVRSNGKLHNFNRREFEVWKEVL